MTTTGQAFDPQAGVTNIPGNTVSTGGLMSDGQLIPQGFADVSGEVVRIPSATVVQPAYIPAQPVATPVSQMTQVPAQTQYVQPQASVPPVQPSYAQIPVPFHAPEVQPAHIPVPAQPVATPVPQMTQVPAQTQYVQPQASVPPVQPSYAQAPMQTQPVVQAPAQHVNNPQPVQAQTMPLNQGYPQGTNQGNIPVVVGVPVHQGDAVQEAAFQAVQAQQMAGLNSFQGLKVASDTEKKIQGVFASPAPQNSAPQSAPGMPGAPVQTQASHSVSHVAKTLSLADIKATADTAFDNGDINSFASGVAAMRLLLQNDASAHSHHGH